MKTKVISILLCLAVVFGTFLCLPISASTSANSLSSLEGTTVSAGSTYSISTKDELLKFASLCTEENNWCEGVTFIITEDIDLNEGWTASATAPTGDGAVTWTPISIFKGVLDGQNHTLKGFYVADSIDYKAILGTGSEHAAGIFCILSGSTCAVRNLNIENSYIHSQKYVGSIAGVTDPTVDCNGLTISNVSSSAIVESSTNGAGGFVGALFNGTSTATSIIYIDGCTFSGKVSASNQIGGFVGTGWRSVEITDCVNNGVVSSTDRDNLGGIYGVIQGGYKITVKNCVNNGRFVTANKNETNIGGIVGFDNTADSNLTIDGCVNLADISFATGGSGHAIGGIIGKAYSDTVIKNCANFGDITSNDEIGASLGGIVGGGHTGSGLTITDCVSAGNIDVPKSYSGGIIGNYQRENLTLTRCVALGTVPLNNAYGGGIIGNVNNSNKMTFVDCYYNRAVRPLPTWVGIRADYGQASFTVKATGKDDVTLSYTTGVNPAAVSDALKSACGLSLTSMLGNSAKNNLVALDWTDTSNGWTILAGVPMPRSVAAIIEASDVPVINGGSSVGGSGNLPDDESLVKKTVSLNSNTAGIKVLGVRHLASDTQLNCDWTGSGIEMNIVHEGGDIVFFGGSTGPCYFRVYIDDVEALTENGSVYHTLDATTSEIVLADVPAGAHNIKVIKVTGYTLARAQLFNVNFAGSIQETAPADRELYIEYVGDSISCGWGTIGSFGGEYTDQDATLAYPLIVSDRLGADWSVTALSGQGLCVGNPGVTRGYLYASALRSTSAEYAFERKADVVVINIGTNDYWNGDVTEAQFKAAYKAFLETVRAKNGEDCKILCLYNTMNDTYAKVLLEACAEFGGEDAGVYTYKTVKTNDNLHPNIAEHKALSDAIVAQLADILDIPEESIGEGIFGDSTSVGTGGSTSYIPLSSLEGTTVSEGETYSISTKEELLKFASLCTEANNWCAGVTFIITEDIDLNEGWTASAEAPETVWNIIPAFGGVLDGQNHTLSGFYINGGINWQAVIAEGTKTGDEKAAGIFCSTVGTSVEIKNLTIGNSYIYSEKIAGALVGVTNNDTITGTIEHRNHKISGITVDSDVIVRSGSAWVGGIVGSSLTANTQIESCVNMASVSGISSVGGIVGGNWGTLTITKCVNVGTVYNDIDIDAAANGIGGIIGNVNNRLTATDCVNIGAVELRRVAGDTTTEVGRLGGIIGNVSGAVTCTLTRCANFGKISVASKDTVTNIGISIRVGGLIGSADNEGAVLNLTDCVSSGALSSGKNASGGLVGMYAGKNATFTRCIFNGTTTSYHGVYTGGFIGVGHFASNTTSSGISFTDCYYNSAYANAIGSYFATVDRVWKLTVAVTGKVVENVEHTTTDNVGANSNAINTPFKTLGCNAFTAAQLTGSNAGQSLTAYDWANTTDNGWAVAELQGRQLPMPATVATLLSNIEIPEAGAPTPDNGNTGGGNTDSGNTGDGSTDSGNTGDGTGDSTGDGNTDSGSTDGTIDKLPDKFDPSLIIPGGNKNDSTDTDTTPDGSTESESESESDDVSGDDGEQSADWGLVATVAGIAAGSVVLLAAVAELVVIIVLSSKLTSIRKKMKQNEEDTENTEDKAD